MKAIIMAGGEGTRLRPLTCDCPKPMMRLMDRPVIEYSFELLARHGVTEAAVTLGYLPERIRDHVGESCRGVSARYYTEQRPLGTAGGVKQARDFLTETFCVLSGDGVTDCDLTAALEFHRRSRALATMVLKRTGDPTEYGLVITDPDGRVLAFREKPLWGEVVTDCVNTGIYILEPAVLDMIPDGPYDFGSQLFPALAGQGGLYGWVMDGYWCDIGDVPAYLATCRAALDGEIDLPDLSGAISPEAVIAPTAVLEAPCYIGPHARVADGAFIGRGSMICAGAFVGEGASVKRSAVWPGARLGDGVRLRGCVIGRDANVSACARVFENSALGTGASLGTDSEVAAGVSVWPGKSVPEATLVDSNLVWGSAARSCFRGGMLPLDSPGGAVCAAQAVAAALRPREIILARAPSPVAAAIWHSAAAGLMAQGAQIIDGGISTLPMLRFSVSLTKADCGLLACDHGLVPLSREGICLSRGSRRGVCALLARGDYPRPFAREAPAVISSGRCASAYEALLASAFTADPALCPPCAVSCPAPHTLALAERAFRRAGVTARFALEASPPELIPGETGILISADGASARFSHSGGELTPPQHELLRGWTALERGERTLIVGERSARALEELCARYQAELRRAASSADALEEALLASPAQLRMETDGIFLALCVLSALTESARSLSGWLSTMPRVFRVERALHMDNALRGRALRNFGAGSPDSALRIDRENARAWIDPDDDRPECRVIAEAYDMETARELCDFCENELRRAMDAR